MSKKILKFILLALAAAAAIFFLYGYLDEQSNKNELLKDFAFGNGRIESTQVDIATKIAGRLLEVYVNEGDIVKKGQLLAKLDTKELEAKLRLAEAQTKQAKEAKNHALAVYKQRESEFELSEQNFIRAQNLYKKDAISQLSFEQSQSAYKSAKAALQAANADIAQMEASIASAKAQYDAIKVNIDESTLLAPTEGRILYKLAQSGEVVGGGQNVLVLLDLLDTYMTIFLPTAQAGVINYGSEARIVLDALSDIAIPAKVTFISPKAQFTPKQIETQDEREKLMFRVKINIDYNLLKEHMDKVRTGLPGVAYVALREDAIWPSRLSNLPKNYLKTDK
ncbi:HlyD family efflux transporter periplasmic adaptor subunit [Sulfurimonas sp.]|uniref:HlyD family secretion protein n=1 Tax=Sulfurimonas sp. TaxID=2022749 RepID=UPI002A36A667|nr:HlyD family efflux transporter periplasmic adaptor subunit [Sulfurimonas sp.]MDY0124102.1 HlyD family efflux transporter periplasmic adaptor subunit [Sulfurimonas sp.]